MSYTEILENLFFIERGYLSSNHFVYNSENPVLIDTGYISEYHKTKKLITGLGVRITDVCRIINTHSHCDHIGGNRYIQEKSGCEIALHRIGKYYIDCQDDWSTWSRYYQQEADFFNCTHPLEDGDIILIGPHEFKVIYTPGHASDGIVLYHEKNKILISSDTLWENDAAVITQRIEGSRAVFDMIESLQKLKSLHVEKVYPGHGKPFYDFHKALDLSLEKMNQYLTHKELIGKDLLKKIMVYTLLMKHKIREDEFYPYLMSTLWYKESVDLYFNCDYDDLYHKILNGFIDRGVIVKQDGYLMTTVKPCVNFFKNAVKRIKLMDDLLVQELAML